MTDEYGNPSLFGAFVSMTVLVLFVALILKVTGLEQIIRPSSNPLGTETAYFPDQFIKTPDRYWVSDMKEGYEGWVGYGAIFVDKDRQIWIAPDWAVDRDSLWVTEQVHIKREGEYIILFANSLREHKWIPGVDQGWGVDKKPNLIRVKMR